MEKQRTRLSEPIRAIRAKPRTSSPAGMGRGRIVDHRLSSVKQAALQRRINRLIQSRPNVIQLALYERKNKGGGAGELAQAHASDLGYESTIMAHYVQLLDSDTKVYVEGKQRKGITGLKETLEEEAVDSGKVKTNLIQSLWDNGIWRSAEESWLEAVAEDFDPDYEEVYENLEDALVCIGYQNYKDVFEEKLDLSADRVDDLVSKAEDLPESWHDAIGYAVYLVVRHSYYDETEDFVPYVQPFIELRSEVNTGDIEEFGFVRKYGNNPGNYGAEFNVERPVELRDKYANKAVLHTHYAGGAAAGPTYGHTKPYDRRMEGGYGYTTVTLGRINTIDDTRRTHNNL